MGSKRALPRHGMIDDGTGIMLAQFYAGRPQHIVRRFEGPMDVFAVEFRQFRHECADIAAIRIEFLTLHRIEDAEKGDASAPDPATHCQFAASAAGSASRNGSTIARFIEEFRTQLSWGNRDASCDIRVLVTVL